jgi:hypothetical protein
MADYLSRMDFIILDELGYPAFIFVDIARRDMNRTACSTRPKAPRATAAPHLHQGFRRFGGPDQALGARSTAEVKKRPRGGGRK